MKKIIIAVLITVSCFSAFAKNSANETDVHFYVNASEGNDQNDGSKTHPFKTLFESAKRINNLKGEGGITIFVSGGTYGLSETVSFKAVDWKFSNTKRLTIRAEVLPDDINWEPASMPVIVSTMPFKIEKNSKNDITGGSNYGIEINTSHVTIQGLRILGEPVHEKPKNGVLIRNYPIVWDGKGLNDLRITQCLFLGNKYALPNHLGILANGTQLEVDHCVFYGVKDALVIWNDKSENSSMHHNLILNIYGAAIWTWSAAEDFKFYNNVISNANVIWVLNKDEKNSYSLSNSMIFGYNQFVNKGGGPQDFGASANPSKLKYSKDVIVDKTKNLEIDEDQTSKYYLQLKQNSRGTEYKAGLFYK